MSTSIGFGAAATSLDTLVVCAAYAYLLESQQYRRPSILFAEHPCK